MGKARLAAKSVGEVDSADLDDLRRSMAVEVCVAAFAIAWLTALAGIGFGGQPAHLWAALLLFMGALGSWLLRGRRLRLSLFWLIGSSVAAVACEKWLFPASPAQYYFPVTVVVSSLLVSHLGVFAVATVAAASCVAVAGAHGIALTDGPQVGTPVLLIYLTALAAWLSSRQMHAALGWMQSSYAQARSLLDEVRERRMALARTVKALEEAYQRIERMNYALIEARSVAEEARQLKAEFAANVSHELRTPLNIILGFSETMANAPETYAGVTWTPALRGDVEQVYRSSRHLSALIDDILDLSALDAHHLGLTLEEANISDVIADAVAVVANLFRAKGLELAVRSAPDVPRLRVDVVRIRQVLINLLTNASRFTHRGGVTITTRLVGNEVQVAVADTGVGIAPEDVAKVFADFGQVDGSTSRAHGGTGLGVPLSKRLVELHGGRMWLESQPGAGTTFYFTLPVTRSASPVLLRSAAPAPEAGYRRAVVALEPDPLALRTLRRHLSGCDVIEASSEEHLPALIEQHQPVALIVEHDGQNHRRLAGLPADLPVIAVSLPSALRSARSLGIEGVLIKPVTREQLLKALAGLGRPVRDILIVDDDPQLVDLLARMLQSAGEGYRPLKALGGDEALARLRQQPADLVLLDILMADVDGLTVLREMKADPALAKVPILIVSAQYPESARTPGGLALELARAQEGSITEALDILQAVVAALPLRGLPGQVNGREGETAPALSRGRGGRPAS